MNEKIDLILYLVAGMFALNVILALYRTFMDYHVRGDRFHTLIRKTINEGNFVEAIEMCEPGLKQRPHYSQLLWFEAEAYFRYESYNRALEKFEHIVNHEPPWADEAKKYIDAVKSKT